MPLSRPWIPLSRSSKSFRSSITLRSSDLILSPLSHHPFLYSSHLDCQHILTQTRRVDEYVTAFQSIAYKTKYSAEELEHRFIVGLKHEIRDKCLAAYPRPEGLGEWIARAYALQHAFDLNVKYS